MISENTIGFDRELVVKPGVAVRGKFGPGDTVRGDYGKLYVFAAAGGAIAADASNVSINEVTGVATAGGGTYVAPATALVADDMAWFEKV